VLHRRLTNASNIKTANQLQHTFRLKHVDIHTGCTASMAQTCPFLHTRCRLPRRTANLGLQMMVAPKPTELPRISPNKHTDNDLDDLMQAMSNPDSFMSPPRSNIHPLAVHAAPPSPSDKLSAQLSAQDANHKMLMAQPISELAQVNCAVSSDTHQRGSLLPHSSDALLTHF
jgi:hypothetical protein